MSSKSAASPTYNMLILSFAMIGILACFYLSSWQQLLDEWLVFDQSYSHGLLALGLSAHSLWLWATQNSPPNNVWQRALIYLIFLGSLLVWFAGHHIQVRAIEVFALPVVIVTCSALLLDKQPTRYLAFAYLYLLFALPIWDIVVPALQATTSYVSSLMVQGLNIPVFIEGNFISIPDGTFEVAGGCSGIRYLLVGITLGLFVLESQQATWSKLFMMLALVILLSVASNWVRVAIIVYVGHLTNMQSPLIADHEMLGWVVFFVILAPVLFFLQRRAMLNTNILQRARLKTLGGGRVTLVLALLMLPPSAALVHSYARETLTPEYQFNPYAINGTWDIRTYHGPWQPEFPGAYNIQVVEATHGRNSLLISSIIYRGQSQGRELVGYYNEVANTDHWQETQLEPALSVPDRVGINKKQFLDKNGQTLLVYSYYIIGTARYTSPISTKLAQLKLIANPTLPVGALIFAKECDRESCQRASIQLSEVIDNVDPQSIFVAETNL